MISMKRASVLLAVALVTVIVGLLGFAAGDVFVIGQYDDLVTLDPARAHDAQSGVVVWNIYEGLLKYDFTDYSIRPSLAESWEVSQDATSCTFHLRKGVVFQDGTPFNAQAVAYAFERFLDIGSTVTMFLRAVKEWEVVDDYTIAFRTEGPWAFWEDAFASNKGFRIPSPTYVKAHATNSDPWAQTWMNDHACGTGPYQLVEWVRAQYVRCVRFDGYWGGWTNPKKFREFIAKIVPEPASRLLMLKSGELDSTHYVSALDVPDLQANPNLVVRIATGSAQMFIFLNCAKPPLNDVKLREALSYAVDYQGSVDLFPYSVVAQGVLPRAMPGHNPDVPVSQQDTAKAKELLNQAGYKPGTVKLELVYITGEEYQERIATLMKQDFAEVGVELTLRAMPWSVYSELRNSPETAPQMAFLYLEPFLADPLAIIEEGFTPTSLFGTWKNKEMGDLDTLATRIASRPARWEIYKLMGEIIWPEHPTFYMWEMPVFTAYNKTIKGFVHDYHQGSTPVYDLWRE